MDKVLAVNSGVAFDSVKGFSNTSMKCRSCKHSGGVPETGGNDEDFQHRERRRILALVSISSTQTYSV